MYRHGRPLCHGVSRLGVMVHTHGVEYEYTAERAVRISLPHGEWLSLRRTGAVGLQSVDYVLFCVSKRGEVPELP